jgi:hypothetical protein
LAIQGAAVLGSAEGLVIRATANQNGLIFNASVNGPVVYLDNWAIIRLAKEDQSRRSRFIEAIHSGFELLFSVTNVVELSGPQGRSADLVRAFLDEIGPHWFPAKLNVTEVVAREHNGERPDAACIDKEFFKSHLADLMRNDARKVIGLSDDFFRLGPIMDRVGPQRESLCKSAAQFDELLRTKMSIVRDRSKRDPLWFDRRFPRVPFNPTRPAFFVYSNFLRIMAVEANSLKAHDGLDFCHAVMACAFASFATLDTQWKRRVASLPTPNRLALVYSEPELDQMVTDMESFLEHRAAHAG